MGDEKFRKVYNEDSWSCPICNKDHSKAHYAKPGQIDWSKKPNEIGRVKFEREEKTNSCDSNKKYSDTPITGTGPETIKGVPSGLMCPHCGFVDPVVVILASRPNGNK